MATMQLGLLATMPDNRSLHKGIRQMSTWSQAHSHAQDTERNEAQSMNPYASEFNPYAQEFYPGTYEMNYYAPEFHLSGVTPMIYRAQESKMTNMFSTCPKDVQTTASDRPVPEPLAIMATDLEETLLHSPEKASVAPTASTWTPASTAAEGSGSSPSEDKASSMQSSPKSCTAGGCQRLLFSRGGSPREPSREESEDCAPEPISRDMFLRARAFLAKTDSTCSAKRLISTYQFQWQ